jgi:hypothetical protein
MRRILHLHRDSEECRQDSLDLLELGRAAIVEKLARAADATKQ